MTRQMVDAMQTEGWQPEPGKRKAGGGAGLCQIVIVGGASVARGCRTAPPEAIVHAALEGGRRRERGVRVPAIAAERGAQRRAEVGEAAGSQWRETSSDIRMRS